MEARGKYHISVSNHLEELVSPLKEALLKASSFERKAVVVPSANVKTFLMFELAKCGCATGIHVYSLSQFFSFVLEASGVKKRLPNDPLFARAIEYEMLLGLDENIFCSLADYVFAQPAAAEKRIYQVSKRLAALFSDYATYGGPFIEEWLKIEGWQQDLWRRLFEGLWITPYQLSEKELHLPSSLHLFGFSYLPPVFQRFFEESGAQFYCLSPSPLFWGDLCTPKERAFLQKSGEERGVSAGERAEFDRLLSEQNPLLAHNSKLLRSLFSLIEDAELDERYREPVEGDMTCLQAIQRSLFHLEKESYYPADETVSAHSATCARREVDALYDQCLKWIRSGIEPKEILVLAPDLAPFAPHIEEKFHAAGLDVSLEEGASHEHNSALAALLHLFHLYEGRFEREEVLKLFSFPAFRAKLGLSEQEAERACQWLRSAAILWGFDADHRQEVLGEKVAAGTWEFGFDRLLWGLAMQGDEICALPVCPKPGPELFEADLLGSAIEAIVKLRTACVAVEKGSKKSWGYWVDVLKEWLNAFLLPSSEEKEGVLTFFKQLSSDKGATRPVYTFDQFRLNAQEMLSTSATGAPHYNRQAIRCARLKAGALVPANAVFVLGMGEEQFPRRVSNNPLCDPLFYQHAERRPQGVDEDRALFLQLFLFAKESLHFSYTNRSLEDGKELGMSTLLEELKAMFGDTGQELVYVHPVRDFDPRYFAEGAPFTSESQSRFSAAKAFLKPTPPQPFFISKRAQEPAQQDLIVSMQELRKLARHPIQFYLNQGLGIYLKRPEDEQEEFVLSPLKRGLLRKQSLETPLEKLLARARLAGNLPLWNFRAVAEESIGQEVKNYHKALEEHGVQEPLNVLFDLHTDKPTWVTQQTVRVPALQCTLESGRQAKVVGELQGVTERGLLFHGKEGLEDRVRAWPEWLAFSALELEHVKSRELLLTKKVGRVEPLQGDISAHLARYIAYYEKAKHEMSPVMPKWADALIEGSAEAFTKKVAASTNQSAALFVDPYLSWALGKEVNAAALFETWAPIAREVLG